MLRVRWIWGVIVGGAVAVLALLFAVFRARRTSTELQARSFDALALAIDAREQDARLRVQNAKSASEATYALVAAQQAAEDAAAARKQRDATLARLDAMITDEERARRFNERRGPK